MALSFSRTDSSRLASGGSNGEIKVWNVKEQVCIHSFNPGHGFIRSLFFAGGTDIACHAVTHAMAIIRLWSAEGASHFASETIGEADRGGLSPRYAVFSPTGSFLATSARTGTGNESTITVYELETMTITGSLLLALQYRRIASSKCMAAKTGGFDFFKQTILAFKEIWMQQEKQRQFLRSRLILRAESLPLVTVRAGLSFGGCKYQCHTRQYI
jgi:WD40 repeat protein